MSAFVYEREFSVTGTMTDRFDRLRLSQVLAMIQQASGDHSTMLGASWQELQEKNLFWAVIRHRVEATRLPKSGEKLRLQTWPMPTTRTAYPRATVALDEQGTELFRSVSLWVLMDPESRAMVLPGKSGVTVEGMTRGGELSLPGSMVPRVLENVCCRQVRYTDLDVNGHMNNCRYLDWVLDLLPRQFHEQHVPREFVACYLSEAREGEEVQLHWALDENGVLQVHAQREEDAGHGRVFSAKVEF